MIQIVRKEDLPACVKIIRASFQTVADTFGLTIENAPRFTAFAITEERLLWQMEQEHRPMFAYWYNGRIIGYYSLLLLENKACELNNICVLPAYRHSKLGQTLLEHAFSTAKTLGCTTMHIGIVEENTVLRQWYECFGFLHTRTKKFDFFPFTCGYMEKEL